MRPSMLRNPEVGYELIKPNTQTMGKDHEGREVWLDLPLLDFPDLGSMQSGDFR